MNTESFEQLENGLFVGYRVERHIKGRGYSGADSRQSHTLKKGTPLNYSGLGVFVTNSEQYARDHYAVHDENVLLKLAFNKDDITSGRMDDREPEISVNKATILDWDVFFEENFFVSLYNKVLTEEEYRGNHTAPTRDGDNAPIYDLTQIYPDDIYTPEAARYYGDEAGSVHDQQVIRLFMSLQGEPEAKVKIYRAVPNKSMGINAGDWVTISRKYAKKHGESTLRGEFEVAEEEVPAKTLYTDANSLYEFGYDPISESNGSIPNTFVSQPLDVATPRLDSGRINHVKKKKRNKRRKKSSISRVTQR